MKEDYAFILGINDYLPPGLKPLYGAINDANLFETWAKKKEGGNIPPENCFKITSKPSPLQPIQNEIDDEFIKLFDLIKKKGNSAKRLYFYFAGHGFGFFDKTLDIALCLSNWTELRRNTALSSENYKDIIKQFGYFEEIIFLVDCCRNTKINVRPLHPSFSPQMPAALAGQTKIFTGYATQYQDQSFEIEVNGDEKRGVFTKVLLNGLEGAAANSEGKITADSLRDYLVKETPILAQIHGYKQRPEISHSFTSDVPLIYFETKPAMKTKCVIEFKPERQTQVELLDNSGLMASYDSNQQKKVELLLPKGLYLLRDMTTDEKFPIQISPSNPEVHVSF